MKKRIHLLLVGIASVSIVLTMVAMSAVFYSGFEKQILNDLAITAHVYGELTTEEIMELKEDTLIQKNLRLSIIDEEGKVLFDNHADIGILDNHMNRKEIKDAFSKGSGYDIRSSQTFEKDTFYYALCLKDGKVLRIAKEAGTIYSVFTQSIIVMIGIAILLIILSTVLTRYFTRKLIAPIEYLASHLDEKEKVQTYEELEPFVNMIYTQHEDIKKGAQMRQDFTANVSHELKTPLTAISGYAELIESGMAGEENTTHFAHEIQKSSKRLLTLINDIIRLSELDTTDRTSMYEKVNLYQIVKNCAEMLQVNAKNHDVTLSFWGEDCEVNSTKEMMEELVYNLCDNAIRYNNAQGTVYVTVKEKDGEVILSVKDTGIGIPKKHQERIFERFYRVDKSRSKSTGGTGLGLAIVKHIVAQSDAKLELISEEGEGTEITVRFPQ